MLALRQLRTTLARNTATFQAARGFAKKAAAPPSSPPPPPTESSNSHGYPWAAGIVSEAAGIKPAAADKAVRALLTAITDTVAKGEQVSFQKFGSFQGVPRAGGSIRSMHGAKEMIEYPASTLVKFKAGTGFKAAVKAPNE
mmetsp:Transcript_42145/g.67720  ORF Transcript_42145/g.67720 Transcript_42145/m.67720 type:complete len:141 (+) Transcript_42145:66-488(+)|eukprot:CAMPEP_0181386064 /NCGR_PEP_ID=MMETSP1106-20121128/22920_1 /TAXON_ID=81844 /ORGANISM="Mantoniella antarctica, Strain SL-175" /LENGTH=140 /DNA_ID=CAMNT_0023506219 /DNA_START=27 /DNA_END=449 /DNA_ORIENTATION=+